MNAEKCLKHAIRDKNRKNKWHENVSHSILLAQLIVIRKTNSFIHAAEFVFIGSLSLIIVKIQHL